MDTALILAALMVALVLGSIALLALLIAFIVRVCVARTRTEDMPEMVQRFVWLIAALERFTPRYQGVRELVAPLRNLQPGQPVNTPAPAPAVIPGQTVAIEAAASPAGGPQ
ncbi:hypothetical protein [Kitasatospora sp. NPDC015120]|uniref:hypothetical protein n=1 Tax=Kitasatospora sp. NPDC015120 TaxID=3364023 RepID=UPI0036F47C5F